MEWNNHKNLDGLHAFLSPSGYSWLNYSPEKMANTWRNHKKKEHGTYIHDLAHRMIITRTKARDLKKAFNMFVNDAIGYGMDSEILLYYSPHCFGTADAIKYDKKEKLLRVHDLKTGTAKPSFKQLYIYCALFCLEYKRKPERLRFECRIYQGNGCVIEEVDPQIVADIMVQIKEMSAIIDDLVVNESILPLT